MTSRPTSPPPPPKLLTLVMVRHDNRVLLGRKLRGFGAGYYNGFGGKVEPNETILAAARRELFEESCLSLHSEANLHHIANLHFHFDDNPQPWHVFVFQVDDFIGTPCETDEMAPQWFNADMASIPFATMWADDVHWWPLFLAGNMFQGVFYFENTHTLTKFDLKQVDNLDPLPR